MKTSLFLLVLVMGALVIVALALKNVGSSPRFVRKQFLTEREVKVLGFLEAALPLYRIMAQVSMGALLKPAESDRQRARGTRNRFDRKIVDYVVVTRDTAEVVALIELDDRTHRADRDTTRDNMTAQADYRTIRIPGRPTPTATSVRAAVAEIAMAPAREIRPRSTTA